MKAYVHGLTGSGPVLLSIRNRYKQNGYDYGYCTYQGVAYEVCQATTFNGRKDWNLMKRGDERDAKDAEIQTY